MMGLVLDASTLDTSRLIYNPVGVSTGRTATKPDCMEQRQTNFAQLIDCVLRKPQLIAVGAHVNFRVSGISGQPSAARFDPQCISGLIPEF
jgi:hypothetical protein